MTRLSIAEELESAADRIADMSRPDLQIILRRAALMLRNVSGVPLEPPAEDALNSIAAEMKVARSDLIARILRERLETNAYLPVHEFDDDTTTDERARADRRPDLRQAMEGTSCRTHQTFRDG